MEPKVVALTRRTDFTPIPETNALVKSGDKEAFVQFIQDSELETNSSKIKVIEEHAKARLRNVLNFASRRCTRGVSCIKLQEQNSEVQSTYVHYLRKRIFWQITRRISLCYLAPITLFSFSSKEDGILLVLALLGLVAGPLKDLIFTIAGEENENERLYHVRTLAGITFLIQSSRYKRLTGKEVLLKP